MTLKNALGLGVLLAAMAGAFALGRSTAPSPSDPAPANLAAAIEAALGEADAVDLAERTAHLLQQLDAENVDEVAEVYDRMLNILGEPEIIPFVAAWARFDPKAALQHALRWPFREKSEWGTRAAMAAWALRDPADAREAFERLSERYPDLRDALFLEMLTGWVYSGQGGVEDYIADLPDPRLESAIIRVTAKTLRGSGVDATLQWANSIIGNDAYTDNFKKKIFRRAIRMIARWDPSRAAAWAMENRDEKFAAESPRIVAEEWGTLDGRAALAWVRNHPDQAVHYQAAREAFLNWLKADRADAVAWLESETLTAFHDPAIVVYAKDLGNRTPADAVAWCERIFDPDRQLRCLKRAANQWYQRDPVAAESWLQQSPLDEEARSDARMPAEKTRRRGPAKQRRTDEPRAKR